MVVATVDVCMGDAAQTFAEDVYNRAEVTVAFENGDQITGEIRDYIEWTERGNGSFRGAELHVNLRNWNLRYDRGTGEFICYLDGYDEEEEIAVREEEHDVAAITVHD